MECPWFIVNPPSTPQERRRVSREYDEPILGQIKPDGPLPAINCFHQNVGGVHSNAILLGSVRSMLACGHQVRLWTYEPEKLTFLPDKVETRDANELLPKAYINDLFHKNLRGMNEVLRYAFLYEQGGLWMDTDIILIRPFAFHGDYFLNFRWGAVCGNVIYAKPFSRHMRFLFEQSWQKPKPSMLTDYLQSDAGAELREHVASPIFFNSIDRTEVEVFQRPITELADHLHDERVFGVHLWNQYLHPEPNLIPLLKPFRSLIELADHYDTDKNRVFYERHFYSRIYDRLLSPQRLSMQWLMEIGLKIGVPTKQKTPSAELWLEYFPFVKVVGVDADDYTDLNHDRFRAFVCDQHEERQLNRVASSLGSEQFDVIIDDGNHRWYDQQLTLRKFFPLLKRGGWYFIEDLTWRSPKEVPGEAPPTIDLFMGKADADPFTIKSLPIDQTLFFDSHAPNLRRNNLLAIRKK